MKSFNWNVDKNKKLFAERHISFEQIVQCIEEGKLLDIVTHPNPTTYTNQQIFVIDYQNYCYLVPYVETENEYFLKTIIPSRKHTKNYLREEDKS